MPDAVPIEGFVAWCLQHVTGHEKGEAQRFQVRRFQALGHGGVKETGAGTAVFSQPGNALYSKR